MYGSLDISTSGMIAQRARFEAIAANIANAGSAAEPGGTPFQRRVVRFVQGDPTSHTPLGRSMGVHVASIDTEPGFDQRYEPGSVYADSNGYVKYPNINTVMETLNSYEAQRAYEANVVVAEGSKTMLAQALRLLA